MKPFLLLLLPALILGCKDAADHPRAKYPNTNYHFVSVDKKTFNTVEQYYVPVYSSMYGETGRHEYYLSATLSIRNIGYTDSLFISKIYYYDTRGQLLKKYLDSTVLLTPMASMEVVVPANDKAGGAGANFVVECMGNNLLNEPYIETVMTTSDLRLAFTSKAVKMKRKE